MQGSVGAYGSAVPTRCSTKTRKIREHDMLNTNSESSSSQYNKAHSTGHRSELPSLEGRLDPHHLKELREGSGLDDPALLAMGVYSLGDKRKVAELLNRRRPQPRFAGSLIIPYFNLHAGNSKTPDPSYVRVKPHRTEADKDNGYPKYLSPNCSGIRMYYPPGSHEAIRSGVGRVFITEGEKKAAKLSQEGFHAIGLQGVTCWTKTDSGGLLHPELQRLPLSRFDIVYIVFDSDAVTNPKVITQEYALACALEREGAAVKVVRISPGPNGEKQGADDYLVAHGPQAFEELVQKAEPAVQPPGYKAEDKLKLFKIPAEKVAQQFIDENSLGGASRFRFWNSEFYRFDGNCYQKVSNEDMKAALTLFVQERFESIKNSLINDILSNLKALIKVRDSREAPCWAEKPSNPLLENWLPDDVISLKGQLLHVPSYVENSKLKPGNKKQFIAKATPEFFSLSYVDTLFSEDEAVPEPKEWLKFLRVSVGDKERILALQQFAGYFLTSRTNLQKALFLKGPTRSGKGTFIRILSAIIGENHVAGGSLGTLGGRFSLQGLLDKKLLAVADARLVGDGIKILVVERILGIVGEDKQYIDRKNLPPINQQLNLKIVVATNEIPLLKDEAAALTARMIAVQFPESHVGKEDPQLEEKLRKELTGILKWALDGLASLNEQGVIRQPECDVDVIESFRLLTSDVREFVSECCIVGQTFSCNKDDIYRVYRDFMTDSGVPPNNILAKNVFCRELQTSFPDVKSSRPRRAGKRGQVFTGIEIKSEYLSNDELYESFNRSV